MNKYTCIHLYIHLTRKHTHTLTHTHSLTHTHTYTHAHLHTQHTFSLTHTHTHTHTHTRIRSSAQPTAPTGAGVTHIHKHTHALTHTHASGMLRGRLLDPVLVSRDERAFVCYLCSSLNPEALTLICYPKLEAFASVHESQSVDTSWYIHICIYTANDVFV